MRPSGPLLALLLAVLAAGCAAPPAALDDADAAPGAASATLPALRLEARGCLEGGGHSVHRNVPGYLPEPWVPADVIDDVGEQVVHSELGGVVLGPTMGNYHATVVCESWTLNGEERDLVLGFVGMKVEPPPFDDGTPTKHYLVTVVATSDPDLQALLHAAGFHATLTSGEATWMPGATLHTLLDTADHGVYESAFATKPHKPMDAGPFRLWWQMENPDGTFSPIALDLRNSGGEHLVAEAQGWFHHLRTEDHAPLPGAGGWTAGLAYRDFDRVLTLGPRPDVKLQEAYVHL